jgi:hypothetical protein
VFKGNIARIYVVEKRNTGARHFDGVLRKGVALFFSQVKVVYLSKIQ